MTQLDKIEKGLVGIVKQRDEGGCNNYVMSYPITDLEYMVRVIKELAGRVKDALAVCDKTPEDSEQQILDDAITEILGILEDNLSPDAKELVE